MKTKSMGYTIIVVLAAVLLSTTAVAAAKPNIVLINMDNFGYGELGAYGGGITRGAPTPTTSCKMADSWERLCRYFFSKTDKGR